MDDGCHCYATVNSDTLGVRYHDVSCRFGPANYLSPYKSGISLSLHFRVVLFRHIKYIMAYAEACLLYSEGTIYRLVLVDTIVCFQEIRYDKSWLLLIFQFRLGVARRTLS